ncbi:MAG: hypothetical protein K2M98_02530 [Muribaculum sp.]|nr:hypothetical protein [Muribaculum sp.]
MRLSVVSIIIAVAIVCMSAQHTRTTRRGKLVPDTTTTVKSSTDANRTLIEANPDSIIISRYDKPLRSLRETFFVTNLYSDTLTTLSLQLSYYVAGSEEMLHKRDAMLPCIVPPRETRQLYLSAWDRQFTYYHADTRIRPKSAKAIPYTVTITPLQVDLCPTAVHK